MGAALIAPVVAILVLLVIWFAFGARRAREQARRDETLPDEPYARREEEAQMRRPTRTANGRSTCWDLPTIGQGPGVGTGWSSRKRLPTVSAGQLRVLSSGVARIVTCRSKSNAMRLLISFAGTTGTTGSPGTRGCSGASCMR